MAKYDRDFLVPYLHDICSLHLALEKLDKKCSAIEYKLQRIETKREALETPPEMPMLESTADAVVGLVFGGISTVAGLCFYSLPGLAALFIIAGLSCLATGAWLMYSKTKKNDDRMALYNKELQRHEQKVEQNAHLMSDSVPKMKAKLEKYEAEFEKANSTLESIYSINIIPGKYRDIYTAWYLYDWFSTSQADDLDMALNTFVLEEIKDRLDALIELQSEVVLNQRIMIAKQDAAMEQQEQHHSELMKKLNSIGTTAEEQAVYLNMIESNTKATAYFAAADYLRRS